MQPISLGVPVSDLEKHVGYQMNAKINPLQTPSPSTHSPPPQSVQAVVAVAFFSFFQNLIFFSNSPMVSFSFSDPPAAASLTLAPLAVAAAAEAGTASQGTHD